MTSNNIAVPSRAALCPRSSQATKYREVNVSDAVVYVHPSRLLVTCRASTRQGEVVIHLASPTEPKSLQYSCTTVVRCTRKLENTYSVYDSSRPQHGSPSDHLGAVLLATFLWYQIEQVFCPLPSHPDRSTTTEERAFPDTDIGVAFVDNLDRRTRLTVPCISAGNCWCRRYTLIPTDICCPQCLL